MRRVVLALGGTIAGLVMLLSFRTHMGSTAAAGVSGSSGTRGHAGHVRVRLRQLRGIGGRRRGGRVRPGQRGLGHRDRGHR